MERSKGGIGVERITYWDAGKWRMKIGDVEYSGKDVDRIASVENIFGDNYDLTRLRHLVEADRDGLCVVLPCKVGDKVYYIDENNRKFVREAKVEEIYTGDGTLELGVSEGITTFTLQEGEFFLTREAAEAAASGY